MHLLRIDDSLKHRWDGFVGRRTSTITDLFGWSRVVGETYGINSKLIAVEDDKTLTGSLALFEIKHPVFGHYLTTAPFATDGGLHYANESARKLLIAEAKRLADEKQVDYLLIRTRGQKIDGFEHDQHYRTAMIDLQVDPETLWTKRLPAKTRNQVRRGKKEGFTIDSGHDQWHDFHQVFHAHMRDLGSPAHSKLFYRKITEHLGEYSQFIIVKEQGQLVAGALLFEINGTAMNLQTVSLRQFNRRCPNYLLYWEMIKGSCERGNACFDMGRAEVDSSSLKFKMNWGAKATELNYDYYLKKDSEIPYVDPRNPRYQLPIAVWKKLPLSVSGFLGPWLIRGIA